MLLTISGVPEGSHIGPLAFILLANSVGDVLGGVRTVMYANCKHFENISPKYAS